MLALVLVAVMALAMGITANAAGDYSITIKNENSNVSINGKTYSAYKVFDLTLGAATTTTEGEGDAAVTTTAYGAYAYSIKRTDWAYNTLVKDATTDATTGKITTKYGITLIPSATDNTLYTVDGGSGDSAMSGDNARALADALASVINAESDAPTASGSAIASDESATISLSAPGYYAVYGTVTPKDPKDAENTEETVAAVALTTTDPTATVNPKAEVPTLNKKITGVTEATSSGTQAVTGAVLDVAGKAAVAKVGSTVSFEIDSTVPDLTGYSAYTFTITDTMSSGLTFTDPDGDATNDVKVEITTDGTANVKTSACTININNQVLTVTIPQTVLRTAKKGDVIRVTYSAVLNTNALSTDYENNTAKLTYSNSPYTNATNDTPDKTVYVVDINIDVNKVAGSAESTTKLANAQFKLYRTLGTGDSATTEYYKWDATNNKVSWTTTKNDGDTFTTGEGGALTQQVRGLDVGTYYLLETAAPSGYNLLADPVTITITAAVAADGLVTYSATGANVTKGTVNISQNATSTQPLATATVVNQSGAELPSTGGIGTTIFYVIGAILVIGAGVILVTRRRMKNAE